MEFNKSTTSSSKQQIKNNLLEFSVFPRNSVNLVVGPTHIGKTYFVTQLLNNYKLFFPPPVNRIFVVQCNERVQPLTFDASLDVSVEQIPVSEFIPENLEENDLVVIDDLQTLTEPIRLTISVCAHHYNLAALFVITHSLLGSPNFELVNYCHRLFLFLSASTNARQILYIINHFYHDLETKNYLKTVLGFCQSEKEVLALELNPLASQSTTTNSQQQVVLAFSHLTTLLEKGYFFLYPYPHWGKEYTEALTASGYSVNKQMADSFEHDNSVRLPQPTLVAIPASVVIQAKASFANNNSNSTSKKCSDEKQWEETNKIIEENIESYFPPTKWQKIKNLAKEILGNSQFCVKTDGKTFHLRDKQRTEVSLIDFLAVVTRRAAPMEKDRNPVWKLYRMHVDTLLRNNAPKDLIKNNFLLPQRFQ